MRTTRMLAATLVALVAFGCGGGLTRPDETPPPTEIAAAKSASIHVADSVTVGAGPEAAARAVPAVQAVDLPFGFGGGGN